MDFGYYTRRELHVLESYVAHYEKEVEDYLFHAERQKNSDMEYCYRCALTVIHSMRRDIINEVNKRDDFPSNTSS